MADRFRRLAVAYGRNGLSFLGQYPGWERFEAPGGGIVAYEVHNRVALACADAVCPPGTEDVTFAAFAAHCRGRGLVPAFVCVTPGWAAMARDEGWRALKIGEEAIFDLATYAPRGDRTKKVRSAMNQARRRGVEIETMPPGWTPAPGERAEIDALIEAWRASRKVEALGFTLRLGSLEAIEEKVVLLARHEGALTGLLTLLPEDGGATWYVEDLLRLPSTQNGTSELLLMAAMDACRARGASSVNTGLAPLRNVRAQPFGHGGTGRVLALVHRHVNQFYGFRTLDHFRAKFAPSSWEERYLVYPAGSLPRVALAVLNAFTPGKAGPLRVGLSRVQRQVAALPGGQQVASLAAAGTAAAGITALVATGHAYAIAEPLEPLRALIDISRAHVYLDAAAVLLGGGWFVASQRR